MKGSNIVTGRVEKFSKNPLGGLILTGGSVVKKETWGPFLFWDDSICEGASKTVL